MTRFIKWTAITAAAVGGVSIGYAALRSARRRIGRGLEQAEQMAGDASRVLASTQQALDDTQQTVRHLRTTVAP